VDQRLFTAHPVTRLHGTCHPLRQAATICRKRWATTHCNKCQNKSTAKTTNANAVMESNKPSTLRADKDIAECWLVCSVANNSFVQQTPNNRNSVTCNWRRVSNLAAPFLS
jgi:hypothetical protein